MDTNGPTFECYNLNNFPDTPKSLHYLSNICTDYLQQALDNPEQAGWANIFAPSEIFHAMDIYPLFMEGYASSLISAKCEDSFIDYAEQCGLPETLCSYHKAFIGAVEAAAIPKPRFAITTSLACDGNSNTFRYLAGKYSIPCYIIDIPYEYSREGEEYVVGQLQEMIELVQAAIGRKLDMQKLQAVIQRENASRRLMRKYLDSLATKAFPKSLAMDMRMLYTSHVFMGTAQTLTFYQMLAAEIETYPNSEALRIFWIHLIPSYHPIVKQYFTINPAYQVLGNEMIFDCLDELDAEQPLTALARKMIISIYNGPYERKLKAILGLLDILKPDAVIEFCNWGCKTSSGGSDLLQKTLQARGISSLVLDGDSVDRRNSHSGQLETRLEAFLEMVRHQGRRR